MKKKSNSKSKEVVRRFTIMSLPWPTFGPALAVSRSLLKRIQKKKYNYLAKVKGQSYIYSKEWALKVIYIFCGMLR